MANWLRKWQWFLIAACVAVAILGTLLLGYKTRDEFVRDFAANLAADAVVGALAFGLATVAFGLTERRQRRIEAQRKAYKLLEWEMTNNVAVLGEALRRVERADYDPLTASPLRIEGSTWGLLIQSPIIAHLPAELVWTIHESYFISREILDASESWQREPGGKHSVLPLDAITSGLQDAIDLTRYAESVLSEAAGAE